MGQAYQNGSRMILLAPNDEPRKKGAVRNWARRGTMGGLPLAVALLTCRDAAKTVPASAPSASASVPMTKGADAPRSPVGADASRVIELARKAAACSRGSKSAGGPCEAGTAWRDERRLFERGASDDILLELLADPDGGVRRLAAVKLSQFGVKHRTDAAAARAVLAAAEREGDREVDEALGTLVAEANVAQTGSMDAARAVVRRPSRPHLRAAIVRGILGNNPDSRPLFEVTVSLARGGDEVVAPAAVDGLWAGGRRYAREVCATWLSLADADAGEGEARRKAERALAWWGACQDAHPALIKILEQRPISYADKRHPDAYTGICLDEGSLALRGRCVRKLTELSQSAQAPRPVRLEALSGLLRCTPREGRLIAGKLLEDSDKVVAESAAKLLRDAR